jgi:uncharacterized protein YqjF (DUF2071 family)
VSTTNPTLPNLECSHWLSFAARRRILTTKGEPLFYADWLRAVFIHYEVDPEVLQREVPFELDLDDGRAYVSLVAFTMRDMRPRIGGRLAAWLLKPISTHEFLNARTYVRHRGEIGIYFLAEWLSNPLSVLLGPLSFGLPYRLGRLRYDHAHETGDLHGTVSAPNKSSRLEYVAKLAPDAGFQPCAAGSQEEFLMERYTAFTERNGVRRFFRIWHPPWPQAPAQIRVLDESLLAANWPWFKSAKLIGGNFSPGVHRVWMGRPQRIADRHFGTRPYFPL